MHELLFLIGGWLGLLVRGSVLLQLAILLGVLVLHQAWKHCRRPSLASWQPVLAKLLAIAILAAAAALVAWLGRAAGLITLAAQLLGVWTALDGLRLILRRWQPPEVVESYWFRAVRPLFLALAVLLCIDRLDGLETVGGVPLIELFGAHFTVGGAVLLVSLPYFLVVLSELPVIFLGFLLQRLIGLSTVSRKVFELIFRYLLIGVGVLWLASKIGFSGTTIAAIAGGLSVGLGFGIKEVFSNFVSGLWLLFEGSVRPGEVLFIDGDHCEVRSLGLRAAVLWRQRDNVELVVPNQTFFTATTNTFTGTDRLRRSEVKVGASYRHDPDRVMALLEELARANPRVLAQPAPIALILDYGDSSIEYALRFFIANPMEHVAICSEVRRAIWHAFQDHGIEIPFPQRVLHTSRDD
ncbi:MAG: mechanosensitive ion channel domain-containing protein [Synechococcaceae cyanobacterium ELA445]